MSLTRPRPVIPEDLPKLLHSLSYAVIKNQPKDILSFAAEHFQQLYEEREGEEAAAIAREEDADKKDKGEKSTEGQRVDCFVLG
ncbi:cAMP-dependent protein kinase type II-beta regulatory subunit-like [Argiope bruennichi]|uniref:cAMP-dependent protein kinase type II-beta regulatory subunit-like n=1 Tax=Argiope bruennichi TaxID=94029 RepID=UPI002494C465|nr:cAMP-dependent protein kinase type II-beta regulatory subunit-like [Argiope bruennichi]XP_055943300.1 cAMP-dependent protein kinase type II-beta regulatory subunit-like [Argiope bruennichi]